MELRKAGRPVALSSARLLLLRALLERPGEAVSKEQLMRTAWGQLVSEGRLTVAIAELRKALGSRRAGSMIATVAKVGYRFVGDVEPVAGAAPEPPDVYAEPLYVGRSHVTDRMREALARSRAGHGGVTLLLGEPGIGKTRAVEELERELLHDERSAWGYCRESGDTPPLWPWQELLDGIHAQVSAASAEVNHAERLPFAVGEPETTRHAAFEAAIATVLRATEGASWLLVLDDLHRADSASLALLLRIADQIDRTRVHLVATLRPYQTTESVRHAALLAQLLDHPNCRRIALERLSPGDVSEFVAAQLDDPEGELARAVYQRSEGNPFFMTELVRQLGERSGQELDKPLRLPEAALDLMRQRVQQIDQQARGVLSVCAVIGRTVPIDLLAELSTLPPDEVLQQLSQALRCDVLAHVNGSALRFSHELIRGVLYDGMPPTQRRRLHARLSVLLEQRRVPGGEVRPSDVAFHCHAALPEGDLHMAIRVCREAADEAASVSGSTDVAHYTYYALEALRLLSRPSLRLRMSLLYGVAIYSRPYDTATYERCVRELIELARQGHNGEMLARANALLHAHPRLVPLARGAADLALPLEWLPSEAHGLRALALASQAVAPPASFEAERCLPLVQRAGELVAVAMAEAAPAGTRAPPSARREVLRASARGRTAYYTALLHQLYLDAGDQARSEETMARLEELARRTPAELSTLAIDLAFHRAARALQDGALVEAATALRAAAARAEALTHAELSWHSERALALVRAEQLADRSARDTLRRLHHRAAVRGLSGTRVFCAFDRAVHLGLEQGKPEALSALGSALAPASEDGPGLWSMKLRGLAAAGMLDEARA
ncbi:MAG TPA: AAA family ATPase, partial [Polyangiales bacterium]